MTDVAKREPGWYAALLNANGEVMRVGPPLDDVLRDAERYRWLRETDYRAGMDANNGEVYYAWPDEKRHVLAQEFDALVDAEIAREKDHD